MVVMEATSLQQEDRIDPISRSSQSLDGAFIAKKKNQLKKYFLMISFDFLSASVFLLPCSSAISGVENVSSSWHYSLHGALWDLWLLSIARVFATGYCIYRAYYQLTPPRPQIIDPIKANGERKTEDELEDEALAEPFWPFFKRYFSRTAFICELICLVSAIWICIKCLARLNAEIGVYGETHPRHPVFWATLAFSTLFALMECSFIDKIEMVASSIGKYQSLPIESGYLQEPLLASDEESPNSQSDRARSDELDADAPYKTRMVDLLRVGHADHGLLMLACVFLVGTSLCQVYIPKVTGDILNDLIQAGNQTIDSDRLLTESVASSHDFVRNVTILVVVSILSGIFGGVRGALFTIIGARVNVRLRVELLDSLLSQEVGFFDTSKTGDLTSRMTSDTTIIGSSLTTNINIFLRSILRVIGVLLFMAFISWQLTLMAFVTVPIVSVLSKWYGRYLRRLTKLQQKKLADGNSIAEHSLASISTVHSFGAEIVELSAFEECMKNYLSLNGKAATAVSGYSTCLNALPQLVKAMVMFYGGLLVQSNGPDHINGGQLVSFVLYLGSLSDSFNSLGGIYASLVRAVGAADKVFELMNRKPKRTTPQNTDDSLVQRALLARKDTVLGANPTKAICRRATGLHPEGCTGNISFENVEFSYPARPHELVLKGLNMDIPAGSVIALVGASGNGKSSIMKLIQNSYEPLKGSVKIDGVPIQELSQDWLCTEMSVVAQEPCLFSRSVRENITYGLVGDMLPSDEAVENAATLANAAEFITNLSQKYETEVGERGMQLSGGQKQRIAIARALVRKPKILLLDEATSSLDVASEYHVQSAIDNMVNGQRGENDTSMTVVIVAHRLSTVRNADIIFVVEDGKIAEQGTHDQLMGVEGGSYRLLFQRQCDAVS